MSAAEITELTLEHDLPSGLWRDAWRRLRHNRGDRGAVVISVFVIVAVFAPLIAPYDPRDQNLEAIANGCCPGPSLEHLLGVDDLGRDELSRLIYGARFSLLIGLVAVTVELSLGLLVGATAGYFRRLDSPIMRLMDIMLAIPGFLMAIGIVALFGGGGLLQVMLAIGIVNIPIFARLTRGSIIGQREADYVLAARAMGVRNRRILTESDLAERYISRHRRRHARARNGDRRCRRPRLPRPRTAGSGDAGVGHDAHRHDPLPADGAVPRHLPRGRDRAHRPRLQPRRRRGCASSRPEAPGP